MRAFCSIPLLVFAGYKDTTIINRIIKRAKLDENFFVLHCPFQAEQFDYTVPFNHELLKSAFKHIVDKRDDKKCSRISPANIFLVYNPIGNHNLFVKNFNRIFATIPCDEASLNNFINDSRNFRNDIISRKSHLLLPLRNYYYQKADKLDDSFDNRGNFPDIKLQRFPKDGGKPTSAFKDGREVYFELAPESHASTWDVDTNSYDLVKHAIEGLYRFGCPIHEGHHYHASKEKMKGIEFISYPDEKKIICAKEEYLNITPNDAIR